MDYLKNVVLQYMTFSDASAERNALVPVLALLLQFTATELAQVDAASKASSSLWMTGRPVKEVKLHPISKDSASASAGGGHPERSAGKSGDLVNGKDRLSQSKSHDEGTAGYQPPLQFNEV